MNVGKSYLERQSRLFTGIIQSKGTVNALSRSGGYASIQVVADSDFLRPVNLGDSIAVNGVCLTVNKNTFSFFQADVMNETLEKSSLSSIKVGDIVNLEKAALPDTFLGGHIVQGHVDGVATLKEQKELTKQWIITFNANAKLLKYLFPKASVAVNGISLTVLDVTKDSFSVSVIPSTYNGTNISLIKKGEVVNIETDIIGKYVFQYLDANKEQGMLTKGFLSEHGF